MNYTKLNQAMLVMILPITCCDIAIMHEFGDGRLLDFPLGYHQEEVKARSRDNLTFVGPNESMYTYRVMPFGTVNGPPIFIGMMFDMNFE